MIQRPGVFFHYISPPFLFNNRNQVKNYIVRIFKKERKDLQTVHYIFCSDEYLLRLNQKYLQHNTLTDILTFDLSENHHVIGEIYISIDRIKENSTLFKTAFTKELHRVIFHGALHLCGYKDKTPSSRKLMRKKEDLYLNGFFRST